MTEPASGREDDPEWAKWREDLQADVPDDAVAAMRVAIRSYFESTDKLGSGVTRSRSNPMKAEDRSSISEIVFTNRAPRWLGYAGAAIAVLAACVVTLLLSRNADRLPLGNIRPQSEMKLSSQYRPTTQSSMVAPSMVVSLTSPGNSIPSFSRIRNASFEQLETRYDQPISQPVPGWIFPSRSRDAGYRIEINGAERSDGKHSVVIESVVEEPGLMGNLMQTLDASIYRNKRIRLSAALRADVADNEGEAQLWLRIDNEDLSIGFFDSTQDRPVRTNAWQYTEIETHVSPAAEYINIGAFLKGKGTAWLDDFRLEIIE